MVCAGDILGFSWSYLFAPGGILPMSTDFSGRRVASLCAIGLALFASSKNQAWGVSVTTRTYASSSSPSNVDSKGPTTITGTSTATESMRSDSSLAHAQAWSTASVGSGSIVVTNTSGVATKSVGGTAYFDAGSPTHDTKSHSWSASASGTTLIAYGPGS